MQKRRGFTTVELVIVIAVIAILATALIPTFGGLIKSANRTADVQTAKNLTTLVLSYSMDHKITCEEDLAKAINEGMNDPTYYENLRARNAKYGYDFWYNTKTYTIEVGTIEEIDALSKTQLAYQINSGEITLSGAFTGGVTFADGLRTNLVPGFFMMGRGKSELATLVSNFETIKYEQDYVAAIVAVKDFMKENAAGTPAGDFAVALEQKVKETTIVTPAGGFRYDYDEADVDDFANIKNVYVPYNIVADATDLLQDLKVYEIKEDVLDDCLVNDKDTDEALSNGQDNVPLAPVNVAITLPSSVKVNYNGITSNVADDSLNRVNTPTIRVNITEDQIKDVFAAGSTDCVIELPTGDRYVIVSDVVCKLPFTEDEDGNLEVETLDTKLPAQHEGTNNGDNGDNEGTTPTVPPTGITITLGEEANEKVKLDEKLYIAYDKGSIQLNTSGVPSHMVTWSSSDSSLLSVTDGFVKIEKLPDVVAGTVYEATITASVPVAGVDPATLTIYIVRPVSLTLNQGSKVPTTEDNITLTYSDEASAVVDFGKSEVRYNQGGYVSFADVTPTYTTSGGMFTVDANGVLTINPNGITNNAQTLTVTYADGDIVYLQQIFNITVKDESASPFERNEIFNNVKVGDFLFRIGNGNSFTLDKLINSTKPGDKITLNIYDAADIEDDKYFLLPTTATNEDGTTNYFYVEYTSSLTSGTWNTKTIKFCGTGIAIIEVVTPKGTVTIPVEVVNGNNVTDGTKLSSGTNNILLGNITRTGEFTVSAGKYLWGNGYRMDVSGFTNITSAGIIWVNGGTVDNVRIVGPVFTTYGGTNNSEYSTSVVKTSGGSTIANCYISGGRAPLRVDGDTRVENTTLDGGRYANLDIRDGTITLKDITTINQPKRTNNAEENVFGFGIVVYMDAPATTNIKLEGTLTQHNYLKESDKDYLPTDDSNLKNLFNKLFSVAKFLHSNSAFDGGTEYVNTGIVFMNNSPLLSGNIPSNYTKGSVTVTFLGQSATGQAYSLDNTLYTAFDGSELNYDEWKPTKQYTIAPNYSFNLSANNKETVGNDYCISDSSSNKVTISMDLGDTHNWYPMIFAANKVGKTLSYTVTLKQGDTVLGDYTNKDIPFSTAGEYVVEYTYVDSYNYALSGETITSSDKTYTKKVYVTVLTVKPNAKPAEFNFYGVSDSDGDGKNYKLVEISEKFYYLMPDVSAPSSTIGSKTVNGVTVYYPIVEAYNKSDGTWNNKNTSSWNAYFPVFWKVIAITDYADGGTGSAVSYDESTSTLPAGLKVKNPTTTFQYQMNVTAPADPVFWNNHLAYKCGDGLTTNARTDQTINAEYTYIDEAGNTYTYFVAYHCPEHIEATLDNCVTPDTLITLADGTQVRVDSLTGNEYLLVWNMETGKLDFAPIMFVDSDPNAAYEVIKLYFSDGTEVKVISEHGFWDYDLNRYLYLDKNAAQYIGHWFAKQTGDVLEKVQLVDVVIETETTSAWSPVTQGHLCYFVNGMLSMPGGVGGLFNIFDVDAETMTYDYEAIARDIETYGLFTYEELNAITPLSEDMFNMAGGAYLKISIGKGNMTMDELITMIQRYSVYFN